MFSSRFWGPSLPVVACFVSGLLGACGIPAPSPPVAPDVPAEAGGTPAGPPDGVPIAARGAAYVDGTLSFLPNVGGGLAGGRVLGVGDGSSFAAEIDAIWQFIDDEAFIDDGHPAAGDWYQVRGGVKSSKAMRGGRRRTLRLGAVWFRANGVPNLVQEPGDYWGTYGSLGFESRLSAQHAVGPELALMLVVGGDEPSLRIVPQVLWRATRWAERPSGVTQNGASRRPPGEIYASTSAVALPGAGAVLGVGQVFARTSLATWSVEGSAGLQHAREGAYFHESGRWGQVRIGAKAAFDPGARGHWAVRAGVMWLRTTAANDFTRLVGDHVGVYLGGGYEYELTARLSVGPETTLAVLSNEKPWNLQVLPQLRWHFVLGL